MLPLDIFKTIIASTPLISIDLIVRNDRNQVLLGKRINRPAQGFWFVPGGRVLKDESLESAFKRLLKSELNIAVYNSKFKGVYQHFYDDNFSGIDFTTHYVVLAYEIECCQELTLFPQNQHSAYKWFSEKELLIENRVHKHTKWYFEGTAHADVMFANKPIEHNIL